MSQSSILELVDTVIVPATTVPFVVRDKFIVDTSPEAKVKIEYLNDNFKAGFLDKTEWFMFRTILRVHKLRRYSWDAPIIAELGGEAKAEVTLQEIFSLMERQGHGEAGILLTNRYTNVFYVRDKYGVLRPVDVIYRDDAWYVCVNSVLGPNGWCEGILVFSRVS